MIEMPIRFLSASACRTTPTGQTAAAKAEVPAPKTDVVDLSKPPTPEQAERMRSAGILGYGSVSARKTVTTEPLSKNVSVTHVTADYQSTFFDVVNEATVQTSFSGAGVFTSGGSAYIGTASQLVCSWKDGSQLKAELRQAAYSFHMSGMPDWYIPAHKNADGSIALAQFGPCTTAAIRGYHSTLTIAQSGGGQTQVSQYETSAYQEVTRFPDQKRPAGAADYKDEKFNQIITDELLARIDKCAQALRSFDMRA